MTEVVNIRSGAPYDVYIGRGSDWGNPYSHRPSGHDVIYVATRDEALGLYAVYLLEHPELRRRIRDELAGRVLGCYCKPLPCHGDLLAELADL